MLPYLEVTRHTKKIFIYFKECIMALNEMKINCERQSESIKAARKLTQ
jgi:hypothetical protein